MDALTELFGLISRFRGGSAGWLYLIVLSGLFWGVLYVALKFTRDKFPGQFAWTMKKMHDQHAKLSAENKKIAFLEQKIQELEAKNRELESKLKAE